VTERAVFRLQPEGLELIEAAPGIDIQKDIVDQMEFVPLIRQVRTMKL
jgi:propionate CoA-transferase